MTGEAHWLPLAFVIAAALPVLYLYVRGRRADRNYQVEEKNVRCRTHDNQLAHCTLVRDAKTGEPIGIRDCSARQTLDCGKTCLPLFAANRPAPSTPARG